MRKDIRQLVALILIMVMTISLAPLTSRAQRPGRPPARDFEGTPVLAAGTEVVPEGTYILLEMETRLNSKDSRQSDRFKARVAAPVVDAQGRTLIPEAAYVEGHVSAVTPARWRRRSGIIAIEFDNLYLPNGESIPIRGYLTSADAADRKRIDDEGSIRGGAPRKRDIVFIGGGAAAGAAIGLIAGGALAGAGIGAAVGLTATFLMKGVEAIVEEGDRIAIGLTQDLRIEPAGDYMSQPRPAPSRTEDERTELRPLTPATPESETRPEREKTPAPAPSGLSSGAVNLNAIRSERGNDGLIRILITAETPTTGWRIFTNHEILRDSVEIRLQGTPPTTNAPRQISHPTAPTIVIQDRSSRIQKIVVHGRNTVQTIGVNNSWTDRAGARQGSGSSTSRPASRPTSRPTGSSSQNPPANNSTASEPIIPAESASTSLIETASRIEKDIDLIRFNFASSIGIWLNRDGTFDALTGRRPTNEEKRFLDGLGALATSVRTWHFNSPTESARRTSILRIREDAQVVEGSWRRISMSNETNQLVREMLGRVAILVK
jgi:hypothetical protein